MSGPSLEDLVDQAELRALVQRISRAVDARDFDSLDKLFDPDGEVHGAQGALPVGQYLDRMRSSPGPSRPACTSWATL